MSDRHVELINYRRTASLSITSQCSLQASFKESVQVQLLICKTASRLNEIELKIRCSLHVGEVVWRNDDITGIAINIPARALEKCQSNTVIITKNLKDLLGRTKFSVTSMGNYSLKGLEGDWELFEVENHQ